MISKRCPIPRDPVEIFAFPSMLSGETIAAFEFDFFFSSEVVVVVLFIEEDDGGGIKEVDGAVAEEEFETEEEVIVGVSMIAKK